MEGPPPEADALEGVESDSGESVEHGYRLTGLAGMLGFLGGGGMEEGGQ